MGIRVFLTKVLAILALILTIFVILCSYYSIRLNKAHFYTIPGKEIVFIGDSRVETGLNDRLDNKTFNVAQSAESYLYSYIKLRKLLPLNKGIKRVVLGFSDLNLHVHMDDWYYKDQPLQFKVSNFLFLMRPDEVLLLARNNFSATVLGIIDYPKFKFDVFKNMKPGDKINTLGVGRFEPQYGVQLKVGNLVEAKTMMDDQHFRLSLPQVKFLDKIAQLCKQQGVELILLSTPLHKSYQTGSRHSQVFWKEHYPNLRYLDFTTYQLSDSLYVDFEHLNDKGAEHFTRIVLDSLQKF